MTAWILAALILASVAVTGAALTEAAVRRYRILCSGKNGDFAAFGNEWLSTELLRFAKQGILTAAYFVSVSGAVKWLVAATCFLMALTSLKSLWFRRRYP